MAVLETSLSLGFPALPLFLRNEFFLLWAVSFVQMLPSWSWDGGVTCRMSRLALLPSPEEKNNLLWLNFMFLLTLQQPFGLCCFCFVDEFILHVISPLNFKDMYLPKKNKGRKTTCKLSQEKPLLKAISLLTDGRISWKASTIFTESNPFSKPKKCYLILSPVYVYVLE